MKPDPMTEPDRPKDERFVYMVTAARVEVLRQGAAAFGPSVVSPPRIGCR